MPVIITMTCEPTSVVGSGRIYDYSDRILRNILNNEHEVFYSGQNQGKADNELIDSIKNNENFKIYYRPTKNVQFTYLGETNKVDIIQYRKIPIGIDSCPDERNQFHMALQNIHNITVPINNFTGCGCFKKDVLVHSGLRDTNDNHIISHNNSVFVGFYKYNVF